MSKSARRLASQFLCRLARRVMQALRLLFAGVAIVPIMANAQSGGDIITSAVFVEPTDRYGHDVLGPNAEWGALRFAIAACVDCQSRDVTLRLPPSRVFEDLEPRLIDLDGDSYPEVVVIESDSSEGARLAVYDATGLIAATPFIGTAYRWLAPLGAADLDGDGIMELAYIDRPHLAKTLRVWRYHNRSLQEVASLPGLTNHKIGQAFISGGIRDCGSGAEIITADARWRRVVATRVEKGTLVPIDIGAFENLKSLSAALACP